MLCLNEFSSPLICFRLFVFPFPVLPCSCFAVRFVPFRVFFSYSSLSDISSVLKKSITLKITLPFCSPFLFRFVLFALFYFASLCFDLLCYVLAFSSLLCSTCSLFPAINFATSSHPLIIFLECSRKMLPNERLQQCSNRTVFHYTPLSCILLYYTTFVFLCVAVI